MWESPAPVTPVVLHGVEMLAVPPERFAWYLNMETYAGELEAHVDLLIEAVDAWEVRVVRLEVERDVEKDIAERRGIENARLRRGVGRGKVAGGLLLVGGIALGVGAASLARR